MSDDENNLGASAFTPRGQGDDEAPVESLIGRSVRISLEAKDLASEAPHMWAGKYGEITSVTPFGAFMVSIGGKKTKQFDLKDLELLSQNSAATEAADPAGSGTVISRADPRKTELVEAPPLQAINSPTNPRRRRGLDIDSLNALAASIRAQGIAQPILVRPLPPDRLEETSHLELRPAYEIVAGERRWRAAQIAELATMPMLVRDLSDAAVLEIQLVENIEREDLDAMEEAEGFSLLRDKLGYSVEQIADRIGRGKGASYVRKTMKLLDLAPESREAMFEGHLGRSTGLLVARYPAERQAAVVDYIKSQAAKRPGTDPEPAPFRVIASALYSRFNTDLGDAAFDIDDAQLVPAAGACTGCPKRTSTAQDLFDDASQTSDSCTDEACYASKKEAHVQVIRARAIADGFKVIDGDEARQIKPSPHSAYLSGYTRLEAVAETIQAGGGLEREVTFEDALRRLGRKAPKPIVLIDPHTCKAIKVIPDELANKLAPDDEDERQGGALRERGAIASREVDTRPPEEIAWDDNSAVRRAALFRAFDVIRSGERTTDELRRTAMALMGATLPDEALPRLETYWGWTEELEAADDPFKLIRDKVLLMEADALGQLIAMASLELILTSYPHDEDPVAVLGSYGIDLLAVRDKVAEDLEPQADEAHEEVEESSE